MPKSPTLRVLPNPYAALDSDGDPSGVCPRFDLRGMVLVGARVDQERSKDDATKYFFDVGKPVEVPDVPSYRTALRGGDLLCADEATAKAVGLEFVEPSKALAQAETKAAARWRAETGNDPSWLIKEREGAAIGEPRTEVVLASTTTTESAPAPAPTAAPEGR